MSNSRWVALSLILTAWCAPALAQSPRLGHLKISARIVDGVATTELEQVIANPGARPAEAVWTLPLPAGATADQFVMTMGGVTLEGEVLDAGQARRTYHQIVARERDPGLLEYVGRGCLRARVFPIPAGDHAVVKVRYRQLLESDDGLFGWSYPIRAQTLGAQRPPSVSVDVAIESVTAIKSVYSPLPVDVVRRGDHEARASFELTGGQVPGRDLQIVYGLSSDRVGVHVLSHRKVDQPGYFLVMLSPDQQLERVEAAPRSIQFVLDTSGSMQGEKIEQARGALRYFVQSLRETDHFNVVPFSTEAQPFFDQPVPATREHVATAAARIDQIVARGGTNIEDALRTALSADIREGTVPITVFLTDGVASVGTTETEDLLRVVSMNNPARQRVFAFGLGHDVNTHLLDQLANRTRAARKYVTQQENLEVVSSALFRMLSHPVLTDVELEIEGVRESELMPSRLPDLFAGQQITVAGRYVGSGATTVRVRGKIDGVTTQLVNEQEFEFRSDRHDFLPTLWAQRRVGTLLDAIRLNGPNPELLDEVRRLGTEYAIVTPYTSHLVLEDGMRVSRSYRGPSDVAPPSSAGAAAARAPGTPGPSGPSAAPTGAGPTPEAERAANRLRRLGSSPTGASAVQDSQNLGVATGSDEFFMGSSRRATTTPGVEQRVRRLGDRTFHLSGDVWVDSRFEASQRDRIERIEAFSEAYFALLEAEPELAPYLALASRMVIVWQERVIEISTPVQAPPTRSR